MAQVCSPRRRRFQCLTQQSSSFMGGNFFCLKACDPAGPNAAKFCQHIYDRIGCAYNAPNAAQNGSFVSCEGDNQDFPGIYTENGQVVTYTQPDEALGAISTMPYEPKVPASSNCVSFTSAQLFTALATVVPSGATTAASSGSTSGSSSGTVKATGSSGSSTKATASGTGEGATETSNDGTTLAISGLSLAGVILSAMFLS